MKSVRIIATSAVFLLLGWTAQAKTRQEQQDHPKEQEKQQEQAKPAEKKQEPPKAEKQGQQQAKAKQNEQQKQQDNSKKQEQQIAKGQQDQQRKDQQQRQDKAANQQQAKNAQDQQREQRNNPAKQQQQEQQQQQKASAGQEHRQVAQGQEDPQRMHQQQVAWQGDRAHSWKAEHRTWQQRGGYKGYRVPDDRFRSYYGQEHGFRIYTLPVMYVGGYRRFQYGGYWFGLVDPWPEYWSNDWYDNDDMYVDYYGDGYYLYNRRYPRDRIAISFYLN